VHFPVGWHIFQSKGGDQREVAVDYRQKNIFTLTRREFSRRSALCGVAFIVALFAAAFVDTDAVLRYFKLIGGAPAMTLETGAIISIASAIPFLAMGMSISVDSYRAERRRE
jgi:hypothetical protein